MRPLFQRAAGVVLVVVCAASWLIPSAGASLPPLGGGGSTEAAAPHQQGTPWVRYLAPKHTCRGDEEVEGKARKQIFAMRCLLDWARRERGLPLLRIDPQLNHSAALKARNILECNDFSHTPCGNDFRLTLKAAGWQGGAGENLVWGASLARSPRLLVDGWLHSKGHRQNLFRTTWRVQGLALLPAESFLGEGPAAIWVHQFGA